MRMYSIADGWGTTFTLLDDARTDADLYQSLGKLGFTQYQELLYRAGTARLYTRQFAPTKKALPFAFDFCCTLSMNGFIYAIGLKNLEDVLQFLKEIDATPIRPKTVESVKLANMDVLLESLSDLADGLQKPLVALKGLVGLQKALERLSNKVEIVIDHILAGQNAQTKIIQRSPSTTGDQNGTLA